MAVATDAALTRAKATGVAALPGRVLHALRRWPILPTAVLLVLLVTGSLAPWIAPHDPISQSLRDRNAPPTWNGRWYEEHPEARTRYVLGADQVGRDVLSRLVYGARISLLVGATSLAVGLVLGTALGLIAGYFGRHVDEVIMRLVDVWVSLPFLLLALVTAIVFGSSFRLVLVLLALLAWAPFVRNVRAEVLSLKEQDYVALARVAGASPLRIMVKHIMPGVISIVTVIASLQVGSLILAEASLSFLGIGIPAPTPAWGSMVADGRDYVATAWWVSFFPGLAIFLVVMSLNFLGDWLRDRLDPRLRQI